MLTTGRSSGTRGVFAWDFEGFPMYALGRDRATLWLQQRDGRTDSRRAIVAASHATHATSVLARTFAGSPQRDAFFTRAWRQLHRSLDDFIDARLAAA